MTHQKYLEEFASNAKWVDLDTFAKEARRGESAFYRCVFSVHFFNPGMTWAEAEDRVRQIIRDY